MYNYTNKFFAAANSDKSEIIISFYQQNPSVDPSAIRENDVTPIECSEYAPVANVVMTGMCAQNLIRILSSVLSDDGEDAQDNK